MNLTTTTTTAAPFVRITLGGESRTVKREDAIATMDELHAKHGAGVPRVEEVDEAGFAAPASAPAPADEAPAPAFSDFGEGNQVVDAAAKARIDAQQAALRAGGMTGIGYAGEGGSGAQLFANGTRMMAAGYDTQRGREAAHKKRALVRDAAHELIEKVRAEGREDVVVSSGELARAISYEAGLRAHGFRLSEQALRGLLGRLESPALGYLFGLGERIQTEYCVAPEQRDEAMLQVDIARATETLMHELARRPDVMLKLRTRTALGDVFAVVSPAFAPADAPDAVAPVVDALPAGARGEASYDPESTQWELRASVWTPTPADEQAVGEAFEGFVSYRARDNGTRTFDGSGGVSFLACLNASVYTATGTRASRMHIGKIMHDVAAMTEEALRSITLLCEAWGRQREAVVEAPKGVTIEEAIPGFWRALLKEKPLARVLAGRREENVQALSTAYFDQRRDQERIVRADFGQAWTRMIQGQPLPNRRDAENAIGDWLVDSRRSLRCDLRRDVED